uniref:Uncharacterized protein n=1 Tax=Romanomermis culicivorax TaxID=13658 RepID=A0A915JD20_ROMCU
MSYVGFVSRECQTGDTRLWRMKVNSIVVQQCRKRCLLKISLSIFTLIICVWLNMRPLIADPEFIIPEQKPQLKRIAALFRNEVEVPIPDSICRVSSVKIVGFTSLLKKWWYKINETNELQVTNSSIK